MSRSAKPTRRQFLQLAGATTVLARAAEEAFAQEPAKPVSPNDRIRLALLGAGGMGQGDTETALKVPGVELVAAADIYDGRFEECRKKFGKDLQTTRDYREVLARKDVDAVIVASPDHWHMQMTIDALEAGKDVYCEKPMMHSIDEGARMLAAQKKTGRILQVGSQCVSSIVYAKARELFASGAIGKVNLIEGWTNRNSVMGALHWPIPKDASPQTVDWDRFLGQAPKRPFEPARLFRWRLYNDYGTGITGRPLRAPVLRDALRDRRRRPEPRLLLRGPALLDGRPRDPGRHGGGLRLPRPRRDAGLQPHPQGELRGRRRDERVGRDRASASSGTRASWRWAAARSAWRGGRRSRRTGTPSPRRRRACPMPPATASPRPAGTTTASTTSSTSSRRCAAARRSSRTRSSACARRPRRCCAT